MNKTKIDWCDVSWNPLTGCKHSCSYCYAEKISKRFTGTFKPTYHPERLKQPYKSKKPLKIFVCSMGDLFGEWVDKNYISQVLQVVYDLPYHTFIFLTKNPKKYLHYDFPKNSWLGFSAATQKEYDLHNGYTKFLNNIKFISFEPLHSDIELSRNNTPSWVIVGAETGNRKEKIQMQEPWVYSIVKQCNEKNIPLFIKDSIKYSYARKYKQFPEIHGGLKQCQSNQMSLIK